MAATVTGQSRSFAAFDFFFDRPRVMRAISSYRRRTLSAQAAYAMRVMRNNQLPGGKGGTNSQPGEYPRRQQGDLARLTFFAYDASQDTAVVGPVGFARLPKGYTLEGGVTTIPQLLNEGGVAVYDPGEGEKSRGDRFRRIRGRKGNGNTSPAQKKKKRRRGGVARRTRTRRYRIEARPYIRLTQDIIAPKLAEIAARIPFR
jgi:hypothetical protein